MPWKLQNLLKVDRISGEEYWHLPYILEEEKKFQISDLLVLSAARCAVVSYNNHDTDELLGVEKAKKIYTHLISDTNPHYTPLEHQARLENRDERKLRTEVQEFIEQVDVFGDDICETQNRYGIISQKIQQLNFYANFDRWVSHRYIKERYAN